jgi:hypothetical protein
MIVQHFLWTYPKNSKILASRFGICEQNARGEPLWHWVWMLAKLKAKKIVWDPSLDNPNSQVYIVSVDGTDFKVWEKSTRPALPIDKEQNSHKFNHGAVKYKITIDIYCSKVVWINGPHRAGKHDKIIYIEELKSKIQPGKIIITDRVYGAVATPKET